MWKYSVIGPLSIALVLLFAEVADSAATLGYRASNCETVVADRLARLNVDMADVRKIVYAVQRRSGEFSKAIGIEAWVNFHSRRGSLVIDMSTQCRVRQVYTHGEYRMPDVPNY